MIKSSEAFQTVNSEEKTIKNNSSVNSGFCPNCGRAVEAGDRFCTECGTKIQVEIVSAEDIVNNQAGLSSNEESSIENLSVKLKADKISSDRMASITETVTRKLGIQTGVLQKIKTAEKKTFNSSSCLNIELEQKKKIPFGTYVHKVSSQTMYLRIESVIGNKIRVSIRTEFANGSYGIENYNGIVCGDGITLQLSDYDLHTQYSFKLGESFVGVINENTVTGKFSGDFTGYCVFKKSY